MQLSHTQREDLILSKEYELALRVVNEYYDFKGTKSVEILVSYEDLDFANTLSELLKDRGVGHVYTTYTNGIVTEEINRGYREYLDAKIAFYKELIAEEFIRITVLSPFPLPVAITDEIAKYQKHLYELNFLQEYLIESPRIMIVKPSSLWANKLDLTLLELWDILEEYYLSGDSYDSIKDKLNTYHFKYLEFISDEGTNCRFELTKNFKFIGKRINYKGKSYQANAPSLEIFTAPKMYSGEGRIVFTKPLCYHGKVFNNLEITLHEGRVIDSKNLDYILSLDKSLSYIGEVALCPFRKGYFLSTIVDENSGCHIALGNAYPYGIEELDSINHSPYHIDLVFGSESLSTYGILDDGTKIPIMMDGKLCIK